MLQTLTRPSRPCCGEVGFVVSVGESVAFKTGLDGDGVIRGDIILPDVQHLRRHFLQAEAACLNDTALTRRRPASGHRTFLPI